MPKIYENPEYIDWVREDHLLDDTELDGAGPERVTKPLKMKIRDMAVLIGGALDDAIVQVQYSPDAMEGVSEEDVDASTMEWFSRDDGTFTKGGVLPANVWENFDAPEGWIRMRISNINAGTNFSVKTRPRTEHVQVG